MSNCQCGATVPPRYSLCPTCKEAKRRAMYQRSNELRRVRLAAQPKPQATCLDCDRPVSRKGACCGYHSAMRKREYLRSWRRGMGPEKAEVVRPATEIYVTRGMQIACPLRVELWRTIAPNTPHLNWRVL